MTTVNERNANEGRFLAFHGYLAFLGFLGSGRPQLAHVAGMALFSLLAVNP